MLTQPQKIIVSHANYRFNARIIGQREVNNGTLFYVEPLRNDFTPFKNGSRILRIHSAEIETNHINIQKH